MKRFFRYVAGVAIVLMLGTPASAATLDPPAGWNFVDTSNSPLRLEGEWRRPAINGVTQSLNLLKEGTQGLAFDAYVDLSRAYLKKLFNVTTFEIDRREPCGVVSAQHLAYSIIQGTQKLTLEQFVALSGSFAYVATYTRRTDDPADPAASHALTTLCAHLDDASATTAPAATPAPPAPIATPTAPSTQQMAGHRTGRLIPTL